MNSATMRTKPATMTRAQIRTAYHNGVAVLTPAQVEIHLTLSDLWNAGDFIGYVAAAPAFLAEIEASSLAHADVWEAWEGPRFALAQIVRGVTRKVRNAEDIIAERAAKK